MQKKLPQFTWDSEKKCLVSLNKDPSKSLGYLPSHLRENLEPMYGIKTMKALELAKKNGYCTIHSEVKFGWFEMFDFLNAGLRILSESGIYSKDFFWNSITENWEKYTKEDYREYQTRLVTGWRFNLKIDRGQDYLIDWGDGWNMYNKGGAYQYATRRTILKWDYDSERYREIELVEKWDD